MRRQVHGDEGSFTLELAVLTPALLLLLGFIVAAGRIEIAGGTIDAIARDAARAASLARTPAAAQAAAQATAAGNVASQSIDCTDLAVTVSTTGFDTPLGSPAAVVVRVSCTAPLGDLAIPGLPGSKTLTASFTSPLDPNRARTS
ncbi:MAG: TadE/TadG family type IV pilus assembly protein [Mycobacteriales bacterium]